jgi:hypothetical protein
MSFIKISARNKSQEKTVPMWKVERHGRKSVGSREKREGWQLCEYL